MFGNNTKDAQKIYLMVNPVTVTRFTRYLVRDDQPQYERASRLLRRAVEDGEPVRNLGICRQEFVVRRDWYFVGGVAKSTTPV